MKRTSREEEEEAMFVNWSCILSKLFQTAMLFSPSLPNVSFAC